MGKSNITHNFNVDVEYANDKDISDWLNKAYHKKFPHLTNIEHIGDKDKRQKLGIDKILYFESKQLFIDEKIRREYYPDILLEEYSVYEKKTVGWMGKKKHTDYIVYVKVPSREFYFLPFTLLQLAWLQNYKVWLEEYGRVFSNNEGYRTSNIPVPIKVLYNAMNECIYTKMDKG